MANKYVVSEANDQKRVVAWLRERGCLVISIPNEGKRSPALTNHLYQMGLTKGAPDMIITTPGGRVIWWEMKRVGGKLSPHQVTILGQLAKMKQIVGVGYGELDAKTKLTALGV